MSLLKPGGLIKIVCPDVREMLINLDCAIEKEIPGREWGNRRLDKYCPMVTISARRAK